MTVNINEGELVVYAGLFGYVSGGIIKNTRLIASSVNVTSPYVYAGGIVGYIEGNTSALKNCYNIGTVSVTLSANDMHGRAIVGGIVGYNYAGYYDNTASPINNCYNEGAVNASSTTDSHRQSHIYAGGIAGSSHSPITDSYNTGAVSATNVGYAEAGGIAGSASVSNSFNTGAIHAATVNMNASAGGIAGLLLL